MQQLYNILKLGGFIGISLFLYYCSGSREISYSVLGEVPHPEDNPTSTAKIELGRKLFFDTRLSKDNTVSCASCHRPEWAFTDHKKVSEGVEGRKTERNSPSILNAGYLQTVMFDAHLPTLEQQVIVPIQEHVEMDISMKELLEKLRAIPEYQKAAKEIFDRPEFDAWVLTRSISAFERSLISANSRFDQYYYGHNKKALNSSEKRGWKIFSEKLYCTQCHPAPHFTNFQAEGNGLYIDYGNDQGRFRIHHDSLDIGKFKVPSLRNIELTFPYMHDGSVSTLDEVIRHYREGGKRHMNQSVIIQPFHLSIKEENDLKNFLKALTDTSYMKDFR